MTSIPERRIHGFVGDCLVIVRYDFIGDEGGVRLSHHMKCVNEFSIIFAACRIDRVRGHGTATVLRVIQSAFTFTRLIGGARSLARVATCAKCGSVIQRRRGRSITMKMRSSSGATSKTVTMFGCDSAAKVVESLRVSFPAVVASGAPTA